MATLRVKFFNATGDIVEITHELSDETILQGMEVLVDNSPIIRTPFYMHGQRYHTICSLYSDEVSEVEL